MSLTNAFDIGSGRYFVPQRKDKFGTFEEFQKDVIQKYTIFACSNASDKVMGAIGFSRCKNDPQSLYCDLGGVEPSGELKGLGIDMLQWHTLRTLYYGEGITRLLTRVNSLNSALLLKYLSIGFEITGKERYPDGPDGIRYKNFVTGEDIYSIRITKYCVPRFNGVSYSCLKPAMLFYLETFESEKISIDQKEDERKSKGFPKASL